MLWLGWRYVTWHVRKHCNTAHSLGLQESLGHPGTAALAQHVHPVVHLQPLVPGRVGHDIIQAPDWVLCSACTLTSASTLGKECHLPFCEACSPDFRLYRPKGMRRCCRESCANRSPYVLPTISGLTSTCACAPMAFANGARSLWHATVHKSYREDALRTPGAASRHLAGRHPPPAPP